VSGTPYTADYTVTAVKTTPATNTVEGLDPKELIFGTYGSGPGVTITDDGSIKVINQGIDYSGANPVIKFTVIYPAP